MKNNITREICHIWLQFILFFSLLITDNETHHSQPSLSLLLSLFLSRTCSWACWIIVGKNYQLISLWWIFFSSIGFSDKKAICTMVIRIFFTLFFGWMPPCVHWGECTRMSFEIWWKFYWTFAFIHIQAKKKRKKKQRKNKKKRRKYLTSVWKLKWNRGLRNILGNIYTYFIGYIINILYNMKPLQLSFRALLTGFSGVQTVITTNAVGCHWRYSIKESTNLITKLIFVRQKLHLNIYIHNIRNIHLSSFSEKLKFIVPGITPTHTHTRFFFVTNSQSF